MDLHVYPNADAHADLTPIAAIAGAGGFCEGRTFNLLAGSYIIDFKPGDTDYDGADGLVPFSGSGKDFIWFDYQTTISGNLELYESWIGQPDRTFLITSIPESGTGVLLLPGGATLLLRRRRRMRLFSKTPAIVLFLFLIAGIAPVSAQQGLLEWPSREGMGYRLQRSSSLGGTQTPWINLPLEYYGTGGTVSHTCFQLEPPQPSIGGNALQQVVPFRSISVTVRKDGSAILRWTQNGVAVAKYVAPPPLGTSTTEASAPPFFDLRATPSTTWHASTNPLRTGGPVLPAVAPAGQDPGYPYRLLTIILPDLRPGSPVTPALPPLTGEETTRFQEYVARVAAIRTAINNPNPPSPPPLRQPFDAYGNPERDFYRAQPRLVDSGPVASKSLRQKGAQRGIRLVLLESLMTCLSGKS